MLQIRKQLVVKSLCHILKKTKTDTITFADYSIDDDDDTNVEIANTNIIPNSVIISVEKTKVKIILTIIMMNSTVYNFEYKIDKYDPHFCDAAFKKITYPGKVKGKKHYTNGNLLQKQRSSWLYMYNKMNENSVDRNEILFEEIIQKQQTCIEKHRFTIVMLEKRVEYFNRRATSKSTGNF
jgi:hypothetical protein